VTRGSIIPIGGAEEKIRDAAILKRFAELCGGADARVAVIPTASRLDETGERYRKLFEEFGANEVHVLKLEQRDEWAEESTLEILRQVDGVFLTGGNQLRLSTTLGGTPAADLLRERNAEDGLHVAGTSAGASFLSEHMIAFGDEGATPRCDMVSLAPGLGLTKEVIIDQHFRQRDRLGRLITALAYNPRPIGIGLDEETAAFINSDGLLEVAGSGAITVVDPSGVEYSSMDSAHRHDPVAVIGLRLHVLVGGCCYDMNTRAAWPPGRARQPSKQPRSA
jgi:cyanophycinase